MSDDGTDFATALADIVEAIEKQSDSTSEMSSALADLVEMAQGSKNEGIIEAIRALKLSVSPTVDVKPMIQVHPADVTVVQKAQSYKLSVTYDRQNRIETATISPIK